MTKEEIIKDKIKKYLCYYDERNPDCILDEDYEITKEKINFCFCDNCFNGRTRMADEILNIIENGENNG
jgi:hypothetical protein